MNVISNKEPKPLPGLSPSRALPFKPRVVEWNLSVTLLGAKTNKLKDMHRLELLDTSDEGLRGVEWPPGVKSIVLRGGFSRSVKGVVWPWSLLSLNFGPCFNHPLDGTEWPKSLYRFVFGWYFNQTLVGVVWPESLQELTSFYGSFN